MRLGKVVVDNFAGEGWGEGKNLNYSRSFVFSSNWAGLGTRQSV